MACLVVARWTEEPVFHMSDAADAIHVNGSNVREFCVEMRFNLLYPSSALQSSS